MGIKVKIFIDYDSRGLFGHEEPIFINCESFDDFLKKLVEVWRNNKCKYSNEDTDQFILSVIIDETKNFDLGTFEYNDQNKDYPYNFDFDVYGLSSTINSLGLGEIDLKKIQLESQADPEFDTMKALIEHLIKLENK